MDSGRWLLERLEERSLRAPVQAMRRFPRSRPGRPSFERQQGQVDSGRGRHGRGGAGPTMTISLRRDPSGRELDAGRVVAVLDEPAATA